jgi:hypothetical protein
VALFSSGHEFNPEIDGLRVQWLSPWHPMLDEALTVLPDMETCPHELFKALMLNQSRAAKRTGLVTRDGEPIGVVGLRRRGRSWEPVGQGVTPMSFVPCRRGMEYQALAATRLALRLNYWRGAIPEGRWIRDIAPYEVFAMPADEDMEEHWRSSHQWGVIRAAQRRTSRMRFSVDRRDNAIDGVVERWAETWKEDREQETTRAPDIVAAGHYYARRGAYVTATLSMDDEMAAGLTCFEKDGVLITQTHWTSPKYRPRGSGTRVFELLYRWAQENGLRCIDIGGGDDYKRYFGLPSGFRTNFGIVPRLHYAYLRTGRTIRRLPPVRMVFAREIGK